MNFQKIPPVETSKFFLDLAFRRAREKGKAKKLKGNWLQTIRLKESVKLDVIKDTLTSRLEKILHNFPETMKLPPFYVKLMKLTLNFPEFKKSFGAVKWCDGQIRKLHKSHVQQIYKKKNRQDVKDVSKQFYGRVSSVLKQIDSNLKYLEKARRIMKTYPDIKEMFTVCLYGFPNVGKTTFLNKIAKTKAKTAAYAFTTLGINAGYFTTSGIKIQVLDVPGTLARTKLNDVEKQAELVLEDVADMIIYVFDLSDTGGYSYEQQLDLYKKVKKKRDVMIYVSKQDITDRKIIKEFEYEHFSLTSLKERIAQVAKTYPQPE